ncbi:hypothetical protein, partial [Mammaliicoccus sciuri]|uniref:hypothetical protein n=1 Tax=Mammaliicoccus sciuri TaxID=1296 RepID=UPI00194E8F0D
FYFATEPVPIRSKSLYEAAEKTASFMICFPLSVILLKILCFSVTFIIKYDIETTYHHLILVYIRNK